MQIQSFTSIEVVQVEEKDLDLEMEVEALKCGDRPLERHRLQPMIFLEIPHRGGPQLVKHHHSLCLHLVQVVHLIHGVHHLLGILGRLQAIRCHHGWVALQVPHLRQDGVVHRQVLQVWVLLEARLHHHQVH